MKLKDVLLGVLIVALIASEILLFSANQQKRDAVSHLSQAQHDAQQARTDLQQAQAATDAAQSALRAENQGLSQRNLELQNQLKQWRQENQQLNQQLGTARQAVQLQRQHLEQLQTPEPGIVSAEAGRDACIANLHAIQVAKAQWALDAGKTAADTPTEQDLLVYLPGGTFPTCPSGGTYTIGSGAVAPSCSVPGHVLP